MKIKVLVFGSVFVLVSMAFTPSSRADDNERLGDKPTGIGVVLGEPTGFTLKEWIAPRQAIDLGLAFSFDNYVSVYSDYLFHFPEAFGNSTAFLRSLQPYVGIGGELFLSGNSNRAKTEYYNSPGSSVGFAIRIPLGAECLVPGAPIGVFAELVPGVGIVPGTFSFLQGGVGARYYF